MNLLGLTSFDQVRGVLTVSPSDLPDQALAAYGLEEDLSVDLDGWLADWETLRDGPEVRAQKLLRLYAKYRCAAWVAASGQNFTLTRFTDGANEGQRSDVEGYQKLQRHMDGRAAHYRARVESELNATAVPEPVSVMGRVSPSRDPVTEGR